MVLQRRFANALQGFAISLSISNSLHRKPVSLVPTRSGDDQILSTELFTNLSSYESHNITF